MTRDRRDSTVESDSFTSSSARTNGDCRPRGRLPGTRLAAEIIMEVLAAGRRKSDMLASYPGLTREDILACLAYASHLAREYKAFPIPA
jgi:uncharacterized protein (DUF433 family)